MSNTHAFHADLRLDGETIPVIIVAEAEYSPGDRSVGESRGHIVTAAKFETSTKLKDLVDHIYWGEGHGALDIDVDIVFGANVVIGATLDAFIEPEGGGVSIARSFCDDNGLFDSFADLIDAVGEQA
jgi:hypothetical protein